MASRYQWGASNDPGVLAGIRPAAVEPAPAWAFGVIVFGAILVLAICGA
jgi:hypothetical protein